MKSTRPALPAAHFSPRRHIGPGRERGAIGILSALILLLAFCFVALSIDTGRLWMERRELQRIADMAALASARHTGCGGKLTKVSQTARLTARNNGLASALDDASATISASYGRLSQNAEKATVFTAETNGFADNTYASQVRITKQVPASIILGGMWTEPITLVALATAKGGPPIAAFTQNASMFSVTPLSDAFDALLGRVFNRDNPLSDTQLAKLVASTIKVEDLMTITNSSTVDELLSKNLSFTQLLTGYTDLVRTGQGDPAALTALSTLAATLGPKADLQVPISQLLAVPSQAKDSLVNSNLNLFGLINTTFAVLGQSQHVFDTSFSVAGTAGVKFSALDIPPIAIGSGGLSNAGSPCAASSSSDAILTIFVSPTEGAFLGPVLDVIKLISFGLFDLTIDLAIEVHMGNAQASLEYIDLGEQNAKTAFNVNTSPIALKYTNSSGDGLPGQMIIKILGVKFGLEIGNTKKSPSQTTELTELTVNTPIRDTGNLPKATTGSSETAGAIEAALSSYPPAVVPVIGNFKATQLADLTAAITSGVSKLLTPLLQTTIDPLLRGVGINIGSSRVTVYDIQNAQPVLVQ